MNEQTQGRIRIRVDPAAQLGAETTAIQGLQIDSIQMTPADSGAFQSVEPKMVSGFRTLGPRLNTLTVLSMVS